METIKCSICNKVCQSSGISTGYGITQKGEKHCYDCCAATDKKDMKANKKIILYLTQKDKSHTLTNWPGTLVFKIGYIRKGRHNWGLNRYDVWFDFNGYVWHGYQIGDNTQLCHCKQTKELS